MYLVYSIVGESDLAIARTSLENFRQLAVPAHRAPEP